MEAESAALTGPPALLERIVLFCIPPAVRETVGGDLCEMYRSPAQYGWQAARALPFVVISQVRRIANLPALLLQGAMLFAFFDAFFDIADMRHGPGLAVIATVIGLLFRSVREAYQTQQRPTCRRAILEAILLPGALLLVFPQQLLIFAELRQTSGVWWPGFAALGYMLVTVPVLSCLRAGLILEMDRRHPPLQNEDIAVQDVPDDYCRFRQQTLWHNQLEGAALLIVSVCYGLFGQALGVSSALGSGMIAGGFAAAAAYLMMDGSAPAIAPNMDFLSLRALYQYELARRHQLRRFLWWLWSAPLFLLLYTNLIRPGIAVRQSPEVMLGLAVAMLLAYFIRALDREGAGPVQERIILLGRLQSYQS